MGVVRKRRAQIPENMNFIVIDRKGKGENLKIVKFDKENVVLNY